MSGFLMVLYIVCTVLVINVRDHVYVIILVISFVFVNSLVVKKLLKDG